MFNAVNGLKMVENSIMTVAKHPTGIRKYGQVHKQFVSIYDELLGGSKLLKDYRQGKLSEDDTWKIYDKLMKLIQSKQWIGANIGAKVGKHKIPRYLYHVTTRENYESMLKSGTLKVSDPGIGVGVYMLELQNMIKHYGDGNGHSGLARLLGQGMLHGGDELVLLKIPTEKLNASRLSIRDNGGNYVLPKEIHTFTIKGDAAVNSKLYKQRKMGLEYIYPHDIPISDVSAVGSAKINEFEQITENEALNIWKILTEGRPEQKAFNNIKTMSDTA